MFNFDQIIHIFLLHLLIFCRIFHSYPISYHHPLFDDNFEDSSDWQPLRIGILLLPSNGINAINDLPDGINNFLFRALQYMNKMVFVWPLSPAQFKPHKLAKTIEDCVKIDIERILWREWFEIVWTANQFALDMFGQMPNFYLINSDSICASLPDVLAAAAPCLSAPFTQRPALGKMSICLDNPRWDQYRSGPDIFRHEILHALGFGMLLPPYSRASPPSQTHPWILRNGSVLRRTAHFMDFAEEATQFAKFHFGCAELEGIEASDGQKTHLSEYFFGNELMTPVLNPGTNLFTMFSALILDETYLGNQPWYRTNRELVEEETRDFWWGRDFGCEFLMGNSCFKPNKHSWPFCTANELEMQWKFGPNFHAKRMCFWNGTQSASKERKCQLLERLQLEHPVEAMKPITLSSQFPEIFYNAPGLFGSEFDDFYCPMVEDVFEDDNDLTGLVKLINCE